ncbi:MAG: PAS domain-containing protein, partial [Deltaproteobacteria bacterium]|nr:PAS domain-containing protein [Deltaproteobacteria bacterium]
MEQLALNVAIVGGGRGCKAIMDMIFAEKLKELRMNLVGVADTKGDAVGCRYARKKGIYTTTDYRDLYKLDNLNMIIELTGSDKVADNISKTRPGHIRFMDNVTARLFWDIFQLEEERLSEREQTEAELRDTIKRKEIAHEQSLIYAEQLSEGIAERKRAERALRKSEREKSAILDSMSESVVYHDRKHRIVWANRVAAESAGLTPEDVVGRQCYEVWHGRTRPCPGCPVSKAYETNQPEDAELTSPDGRVWLVRGYPVRDQRGKVGGVVEITLEITDRKQAEKALRESEERHRAVLEASPDSVVVYDMEGKCTYTNPAFTKVFGWSQHEKLGKRLDYVPDENWPETQMMIDKVLAGDSFSGVESRRYTKERQVIDVSISAAIYLDAQGTPVGSVHTLRDIRPRKVAEEALQKAHDELEQRVEERTAKLARATEQLKLELTERKRAEKALRVAHNDLAMKAGDLEAANEELSQYAYVVSHDLKAPLRAIANYAGFLYEELEKTLNEDQREYIENLNLAVRQGEQLVEDLLEFSGVGRLRAPTETVNIGGFLQQLMISLALSPDVEIVMESEWPTIYADPTLLRQVFQDLIKNGVKFNHSARKRIEIGWRPLKEGAYELFVRDNGIGIEPRYHEQIFGVFQRLHTRKEYEGTG